MKAKRFLALFLSLAMFIGVLPMSVFAYYELGTSLDVSAEGKTYSLFTGNYLNYEHFGMTFLYVVERDGHYYTMSNPRYTERTEVDSVAAIDITEYYDSDTDTFSGIEDSSNIGVMQFQQDDYHKQYGLYLDGNMAIKFSEPWEPSGKEWFDNGIHYYPDKNYDGCGPGWQSKGDGSGYLYEVSYGTGYGPIVYGVLDLKSQVSSETGESEYVFALRDKSDEYNELIKDENNSDVVSGVTAYLFAAPCGHERGGDYAAYDAPTCMEKGCEEYWYCRLCETYFSDQEMTKAYEKFPAIPALGHAWGSEKCNNCGRPVPVYEKVTNKTDFFALAEDTMYVLVAEYEGKYYTPDTEKLNLYVYDRDGDGYADIYNVDENNNGTPDILEVDYDENGVYDYLEECETEEERKEYFEMICNQYLTNLIYGQSVSLPVKEITLNADGTLNHDAVKDVLEFEMIKYYTKEEIDQKIADGMAEEILRYSYECVMQFAIPNTFIGSPCFIPSDRGYGQRVQDSQFDTYYWSVLFYDDKENYPVYDWETDAYSKTLEFLDICKEGSLALCQSWSNFYPDGGTNMECLRLRDYNGKLSFVVGGNSSLEGSEYVSNDAGGYYDTHDKQACVYLYASIPYQASHTCDFGDWVDDVVTDTHSRTCKDPTCGKIETKPHDWDDGVQSGTLTCTEGATVTYTCNGCGKTKTETIDNLGHDWSEWTDDGENAPADTHSRTCKRDGCDAAESELHGWSRWVKIDDKTHKKSCFVCEGTRTAAHNLDAGVITKEASHLETGVKTFTCTDLCGYYYTEDIPKTTEHEWGEWLNNNNNGTHTRYCRCGATETKDCTYDEGVVTKEATHYEEGEKTYTCTECDGIKTETISKISEHQWGEWLNNNNNGTHTRYCRCGATETKDCTYDAGVVTTRPTYDATGTKTYTCTACGGTKTETLDMLVKTDEIVSPDNSEIKIAVSEDSNAVLYENTVIKVEEVKDEIAEDVKANVQVVVGNDDAEILISYDISLILHDETVQPGGKVEVTLPALENADDYKTLQVVYIDDRGNVTPCETRVNADGTITFVTDHFSQYSIIGVHNSSPAESYTITVTDGKATSSTGTEITKAAEGTTVTLTANKAPDGKVFDKWVVVSGDVTLADASKATTTFTMPKGDVSVKATYKDEPGSDFTYGDLNGDGKINLLDLVAMRKYLAKWSITVDKNAADCNADGKINLMDLILLRKYLAKWSVTFGPQK